MKMKIETLKTVDIKTLSRRQLEAAYLRLLKISEMKTALIGFLENSKRIEQGKRKRLISRQEYTCAGSMQKRGM